MGNHLALKHVSYIRVFADETCGCNVAHKINFTMLTEKEKHHDSLIDPYICQREMASHCKRQKQTAGLVD